MEDWTSWDQPLNDSLGHASLNPWKDGGAGWSEQSNVSWRPNTWSWSSWQQHGAEGPQQGQGGLDAAGTPISPPAPSPFPGLNGLGQQLQSPVDLATPQTYAAAQWIHSLGNAGQQNLNEHEPSPERADASIPSPPPLRLIRLEPQLREVLDHESRGEASPRTIGAAERMLVTLQHWLQAGASSSGYSAPATAEAAAVDQRCRPILDSTGSGDRLKCCCSLAPDTSNRMCLSRLDWPIAWGTNGPPMDKLGKYVVIGSTAWSFVRCGGWDYNTNSPCSSWTVCLFTECAKKVGWAKAGAKAASKHLCPLCDLNR